MAQQLQVPFYDGDDYHPPENKAKMAAGIPLTDQDRQPWLLVLAQLLQDAARRYCRLREWHAGLLVEQPTFSSVANLPTKQIRSTYM